uniref:Uncharacterized protein n=1 Tax=Arion vulgaris TaxID=1028688 RepID=A0A0B6YCF7_9EUPU
MVTDTMEILAVLLKDDYNLALFQHMHIVSCNILRAHTENESDSSVCGTD